MYLISPKHLIIADLFFKILSKYLISLRYTIQIPTTTLAILVKTENYIRFSHLLIFPEWIEFLLSTRGNHDLQYFHDSPSFMNHEYARFKNLFDCMVGMVVFSRASRRLVTRVQPHSRILSRGTGKGLSRVEHSRLEREGGGCNAVDAATTREMSRIARARKKPSLDRRREQPQSGHFSRRSGAHFTVMPP